MFFSPDFLLSFLLSFNRAFLFYFFLLFLSSSGACSDCFSTSCSLEQKRMLPRRRCPFCRRWFHPHPRLKQRQKTCGRPECRQQQKRKSNQKWRSKHPDYFRGTYARQKEKYGTRAEEKRRYREQHPDYVRRNTACVRNWRQQRRQAPVSPTSSDPRSTPGSEKTSNPVTMYGARVVGVW